MMTKLGIYSLLAGLFLGLFSGISMFMGTHNFWVDLTISKLIGEDRSETIAGMMDAPAVHDVLSSLVYDLPFFCVMLGLGVIFLIIGAFVKNH